MARRYNNSSLAARAVIYLGHAKTHTIADARLRATLTLSSSCRMYGNPFPDVIIDYLFAPCCVFFFFLFSLSASVRRPPSVRHLHKNTETIQPHRVRKKLPPVEAVCVRVCVIYVS